MRTLTWPGQPFLVEDESALLAARRLDHDPFARGASGTNGVEKVDLEVLTWHPQLSRERRGCARRRKYVAELPANGHADPTARL